jgi:hypothetical protein
MMDNPMKRSFDFIFKAPCEDEFTNQLRVLVLATLKRYAA